MWTPALAISVFACVAAQQERSSEAGVDCRTLGARASGSRSTQVGDSATVRQLAGHFNFVVVATAGLARDDRDTIRRGRLRLQPTDTTHRYVRCAGGSRCPRARVTYPFFGATDASFEFPGLTSTVTPLQSADPGDPGIVVALESSARRLSLIFGNPFLHSTDAGVFVDVLDVDSNTFVGHWTDGGIVVVIKQAGTPTHAQGYLCATRVRE